MKQISVIASIFNEEENIIDFIIVAFVMFLIVKAVNKLNRKEEEEAPAPPAGPSQEDLLIEIRDLLAKK